MRNSNNTNTCHSKWKQLQKSLMAHSDYTAAVMTEHTCQLCCMSVKSRFTFSKCFYCLVVFTSSLPLQQQAPQPIRSDSSVRLPTSATSSSSKKNNNLPSVSAGAPWHFSLAGLDSLASCLDFLLFAWDFMKTFFLPFPSMPLIFVQRQQESVLQSAVTFNIQPMVSVRRTLYCWQSDNHATKVQPFRWMNTWI